MGAKKKGGDRKKLSHIWRRDASERGHRTRNGVMVRDKVASKGLRMSQSFFLPSLLT